LLKTEEKLTDITSILYTSVDASNKHSIFIRKIKQSGVAKRIFFFNRSSIYISSAVHFCLLMTICSHACFVRTAVRMNNRTVRTTGWPKK